VEYTPAGGALLTGPYGQQLRCAKLIVTVSLAVLQRGLINFTPALPAPKLRAIQRIKMGNTVKVLCAFDRKFWPEDMYDVVCPDCPVPEMWMTCYTRTHPHVATHNITGFICGDKADAISSQPEAAAVATFLRQLDDMFGSETDPTPASSSLVKAHVVDWSKEAYVLGAYTYPSLGVEDGDREALAAPVAGTLFFAGEATHVAVNPCMQAALETAQRAAEEVVAALGTAPRSRL
jgi:monoamine oxidase